jgi:hypothetical protein
VFGEDFEDTFRNSFESYEEIENIINDQLNSSKPLVAREVAKKYVMKIIMQMMRDRIV